MAAKKIQKVQKIQVRMTLKPTDKGYKMELIRKTLNHPVADVVAHAKENGVELKADRIYTARWSINKAKKPKRKIAKIPAKKRPPGRAIVKVAAPTGVVKAKKSIQRAVPAQASRSYHGVSEKAMALLILQLGTIKAQEMIDQTKAAFHRNLGT